MTARLYDIEADWQLLSTCNYRCGYCFLSTDLLGAKLVRYANPQGWAEAFAATGLTWLLHLTGGEPSIYPGFVDLCERLTTQHYISVNSNLTNISWQRFAEKIDPRRVSFINAGLHYDERLARNGFEAFKTNLTALINADFPVLVSVVATPRILADKDFSSDRLDDLGVVVFPKIMEGEFGGQVYPLAYTKQERAAFAAMVNKARLANAERMAQWLEIPSMDFAADDKVLYNTGSFTGKTCAAGQKFVSLSENGDVFRCSNKEKLGNMLNHSLALKSAPARCDTSYCPYFCRKYTAIVPQADRQSVLSDPNWWREKAWKSKAKLWQMISPASP